MIAPATRAYADVPAYIYGVTREIWEDRGIGAKLDDYYAADCLVRAPTGLTTDCAGVLSQTLQTLHQFPDRQLVGQDVIWASYPDGSFLSSHRLVSVMRHQGDGSYGPASGRLVKAGIIADCWAIGGVITEEWLIRDQSAFARCLGMTARELAQQMVDHDLRSTGAVTFYVPEHDRPGRYTPEIQSAPEIALYAEAYRQLWQVKGTAAIRDLYFHGAELFAPGGETFNGHQDIDRFYLSYLAAMPDGAFKVESATINRDPGRPVRVAMRWSFRGTHSGFGRFGPPTGAPLYVMGISHAHIVDGRVVAEWVVTDEVAIWKQILGHA